MPVAAGNMNYVSAVLGVWVLYCLIYWFARGRRTFRGAESRVDNAGRLHIPANEDL